jgi:hypothetical protein
VRKYSDGKKFNINNDSEEIKDISENTNVNISNNNKVKEETNQNIKCRRILENKKHQKTFRKSLKNF